MSKQDSFTTEEWSLLRLAPALVAGGMPAADPCGIFGSIKETIGPKWPESCAGRRSASKFEAKVEMIWVGLPERCVYSRGAFVLTMRVTSPR
jgi:hypothetical protein